MLDIMCKQLYHHQEMMNQPGAKASAATVLFFKIRTEFCKTRFERFKGIFLGRKTKTGSTGEEAEVSKGSISSLTKMNII